MTEASGLAFGLIGYPLGHSLSPRLHTAALNALGLDGEYRLYPLQPGPELELTLAALLNRMRLGEIDGLNVTIPHKQAVRPLLDEYMPAAEAIGAVNTIFRRGGRLVGDNTDAPGFLTDLQRAFPQLVVPGAALVLGAGGAARGVAYALAGAGWRVIIAARRPEQARELVAGLRAGATAAGATTAGATTAGATTAGRWEARLEARIWPTEAVLDGLPRDLHLIVNATSAGMFPLSETKPWPSAVPLPTGVCVYDLVYNPAETAFLRQARGAGLPASGGLGMLIEQAALALETWTGLTPPRAAMWASVKDIHSV